MSEHVDTESEPAWPERWLDAQNAPPLARAFVKELDAFEPVDAAPVARAQRWPFAVGVGLAAIAAAALLYARFSPSDGALVPAHDLASHDPVVASHDPVVASAPTTPSGLPGAAGPIPTGPATDVAVATPPEPVTTPPATVIEPGVLVVRAEPFVIVHIDGVRQGPTPIRLTLSPGTHTMRLTRPALEVDETETIAIASGETLDLLRRFEREEAPPPPAPAARPYDAARDCAIRGEHDCVITHLLGHASTAREFELLIASLRHAGRDRDVDANMRLYLSRFPTGRQAAAYRQYLVAHAGR